jgi:hypothetical protein
MEPAKINSLTHKPASRADAGAAPLARAGASLSAIHLIQSALNQEDSTGNSQQPAPGLPHAHAHAASSEAASIAKPAVTSALVPPSPQPAATVEQENGVQVALSTRAVAAAAHPGASENNTAPTSTPLAFTPVIGAVSYPSASQIPAAQQNLKAPAEQQPEPTAIAQARDAERLAGLALKPEIARAPFRYTYDVLMMLTVIVGILLLLFL